MALNADERTMLALVNQARANANLAPLALDPQAQSVAHARAVDMATRQYYSHIDPATGQRAAWAMFFSLGVTVPVSENFYANAPYNDGFVDRAMRWLMGDSVHRRNVLLPQWTAVGVGVASNSAGIGVATQEFAQK